jgi:hypothetical protein
MKNGFVTLLTVLIIGAVGTAAAISVILLGVGSSRSSLALEQSGQAKTLANSCVEAALEKIRESNYTGSNTITLGQGSCSYSVVSPGPGNFEIHSTGTVGTTIRKVKVLVDSVTPQIHVSSWEELADF